MSIVKKVRVSTVSHDSFIKEAIVDDGLVTKLKATIYVRLIMFSLYLLW